MESRQPESSETHQDDSPTVAFGLSSTKLAAMGVGVALLLIVAFKVTKPVDVVKFATDAEVQQKKQAFREMQAIQYGPMTSAEELGVTHLDAEEAKNAAIKHLGDGDYTPPEFKVGRQEVASGGVPGTRSAWSRWESSLEYVPNSQRKLCSRTVFGANVAVRYEKSGNDIEATAVVDVDQSCMTPSGSGINGLPRGTISVSRRYVWKDRGYGIHEWEYDEMPKKTSDNDLEKRIQEGKDAEAAFRKEQEEREKRHERHRALRANRNASY